MVVAPLGVGVTQVRRLWPGDVETGAAGAHGAQILRYDVRSRFGLPVVTEQERTLSGAR